MKTEPLGALLVWIQNIALGVLDEGWGNDELSNDKIDIRIRDSQRQTLVDRLT